MASLRLRREHDRAIGRSGEALRPIEPVWEELEESVNLLRCAVQRLLNGLIALERLRNLGLEDLVDLRPLRRRRARPAGRNLLQIDGEVLMDLDEQLCQILPR